MGLLIAVAILGVLRTALLQVGGRLMDAVDPDLVERAHGAVLTVEGVREVLELRLRWIGHTLRAEADESIDPGMTVSEAHAVAHHTEEHLAVAVPRLAGVTVHVSPSGSH